MGRFRRVTDEAFGRMVSATTRERGSAMPTAKRPAAKKTAKKTTKATAAGTSAGQSFTAEEKAAIKERAAEARQTRKGADKADDEQAVLDKIAEMSQPDRGTAERVHAVVMAASPDLEPRTWYGMPAYAKGGKVILFFQNASKFKARYATLGFNDSAALDDGDMWPTSYAITTMTPELEKQIAQLVRKAVG